MIRYLAPVGTPISVNDLRTWLYNAVVSKDILHEFNKAFCRKYNIKNCFFISSGRAALYILLRLFSKMAPSGRNEVIITSYNSCSVLSSITKAGLKIRVCDINMNTLDYDYRKLSNVDFRKVLCIVSSNLYGIPNDLTALAGLAHDKGVYLIDDAAQCMGGRIDGKFSGTFGDAGIYSLGKGKNITSVEGGVIVTDSDDIASLVQSQTASLPETSMVQNFSYIAQLLVYSALLHPALCAIPAHIPALSVEKYIPEFPVHLYSRLLGAMGFQLFNKIGMIENIRIQNAHYYREHLQNFPFIRFIHSDRSEKPVFLRFPFLVEDASIRDRMVKKLNENGFWTTKPYPLAIIDIQEIKDHVIGSDEDAEAGRAVAEQLVTLPTHSYVTGNDRKKIVSIIKSAA